MKLRISNPFRSGISAILTVLTLGCFAAPSTQAASIYWDGTSASWNTNTNWSTASGADTPDPVAVPGAADDAIFNISTVNDPETITLDANQAANSMTFDNTGTTALTGGGTARTLALGTGGITVAATAGAVTLGDGTAANNVLLSLSGAQTWTNNTANAFTISNTAATFTRATGATLLLNKASTGDFAISTTVAPLVNTIVGPWAFFGTGADQKYAVSGASVTGKTGTSTTSMSHTGATTNYELSGTALTLGGGNYASNTIRYAGTGATYNFTNSVSGGSSYTTNGILAVGASGTLTLRNTNTADDSSLMAGSTGELVIAGQQAVTINVPIDDGTPTASRLIYSGSNTLILGGANTYTGSTTVSSGTLRLNSSLALQNSPLNTSGSITGNSTNGLKTALTALTLGGLTGDKDLASLFTTTAGGYNGVANLTLNPGSSASSYSGVIANGAANMNLIKTGAGAQALSGVNTYTGTTTISEGALILNNATALGTTPGVDGTSSISMAAGTTLRSNYIIADAGNVNSFVYAPITLTGTGSVFFLPGAGSSAAPAEAVTFNLNGAIGGTAGTNVVFSTPTTSLSNADSIIVLGAASTYDGTTTINTGNSSGADRINVKAGVPNALPTTTVLIFGNTVGSGSFRTTQYDLNGNNQTLAGLDNGGVVPNFRRQTVTNSGTLATLTINNSADFTFGGATTATNGTGTNTSRAQITGNIALVKSGAGTLTLGGTLTGGAGNGGNTYNGGTTVNGGTLRINNNETGVPGALTVGGASATGSPTLAGTGTIGGTGGTVTIAAASGGAAGTLAPGSGGIGNLVINNKPLTFESGSTASFEVDADTIANRDRVTGISALTYSGKLQITATGILSAGDTWDIFDFTSQSGTFDNNSSFGTDGSADPDLPDLGAGLTWEFDYTTGTLSVAGSGSGFAAWQSANSTAGGLDQDHDGDGVDNGTEFFIYGPVANSGFTPLPSVVNTGGTLSVTWTKAIGYTGSYPADFVVETSDTLAGSWNPETLGVNVAITGPNNEFVTYTFPAPLGSKKFARLKVTGP